MDKHKKSNENNLKIEDKNLSVNNLLSTNQKDSLTVS